MKLPYDPDCRSVSLSMGWMFGRSVGRSNGWKFHASIGALVNNGLELRICQYFAKPAAPIKLENVCKGSSVYIYITLSIRILYHSVYYQHALVVQNVACPLLRAHWKKFSDLTNLTTVYNAYNNRAINALLNKSNSLPECGGMIEKNHCIFMTEQLIWIKKISKSLL